MQSNRYIITYIVVLSALVALFLALAFSGLKPIHDANEEVFKKRDILSAIKDYLPIDIGNASTQEVLQLFDEKIKQVVIDANGKVVEGMKAENVDMKQEEKKDEVDRLYPLFIYEGKDATYYLASVRGNGLWDKIWGTIAISDDFNTIAGVSFDHVTETAGLGAEIKDSEAFKKQFQGKKLYTEKGEYRSVAVVKRVKIPPHQVDAIAGATITSNGVTEMMYQGLSIYLPYFESMKK